MLMLRNVNVKKCKFYIKFYPAMIIQTKYIIP